MPDTNLGLEIMKKLILSVIIACLATVGFAQKPLSFSTVIQAEGVNAQTLYDLTKNWMAKLLKKPTLSSNNLAKKLQEGVNCPFLQICNIQVSRGTLNIQ